MYQGNPEETLARWTAVTAEGRRQRVDFIGRYAFFHPVEAGLRPLREPSVGDDGGGLQVPHGWPHEVRVRKPFAMAWASIREWWVDHLEQEEWPALTYNRDTLPFPDNRVPRVTYEDIRNWGAFDPARHPFAWNEAEEARLRSLVRAWVPPVLSGMAGWWEGERRCESQVDAVLRERYGTWAWGWSWCHHDGGPIGNWASGPGSVTTPDETAARVVAALLEWREWREWLERTAQRFAEPAPPPDASPGDRSRHLERACVRLVTHALDSGADNACRGQTSIVLGWFLTNTGMDRTEAAQAVENAIGGRFKSWVHPERTLIESVSEDLAVGLTGHVPYQDHRERAALEETP